MSNPDSVSTDPAQPPRPKEQGPHPQSDPENAKAQILPPEIGGRDGPDPTRYGDWEKDGKCTDF